MYLISKTSSGFCTQVWRMGYNGTGINIAIIDSGFDIKHDDLARKFVSNSKLSFIKLIMT